MKTIRVICIGKLRFPGLETSATEYQKRIGRYVDFDVIELKAIKADREAREAVLKKESEAILNAIHHRGAIWILDEAGANLKTSEWAREFQKIEMDQGGELTLIIGGSLGISSAIKSKADRRIAFGPQTASHELIRVVLFEQLFRVLSLNAGHPYHNEG